MPRHTAKCSAKLMPPISMNTVAIMSMGVLFQYAMDASWVEKPPVETVLKLWQMASNSVMPAAQ